MAKILFLTHQFFPDIGGIEAVSEILATNFAGKGHMVELATWTEDTGEKEFPFKIVRKPGKLELIKLVSRADIIFENNPSLRLSWPNFFYSKPHVVAVHTWISRPDGTRNFVGNLKVGWLRRADRVIVCSSAIEKQEFPGGDIIGSPYDERSFYRREEIPKTDDFVFLGRLVPDKGAGFLIEAFHRLISERKAQGIQKGLRLKIIGDGPERAALKKKITELDLEGYVKLRGALSGESLAVELNRHRYMIVPSLWKEPFGVVALEGMACGCIPIVADGGGLPEAIGDAGLTFKGGDVDSLASEIQRLLNDPDLERRLCDNAKDHLRKFSSRVITEKYLDVIQSVIAKH